MKLRAFLVLITAFGIVFALSGCHGSGKPKVAFVSNNAEGFWTFAQKGAEKAAAEMDVELAFRKPPKGTVQEQREIIEDLRNRGFKGIAVSPNDPDNTLSFYKNDIAPKVALVAVDNDLPEETVRRCYIGTHNYRAGRAAGELVKKAVPKGGRMDATNAVERRQGVLDVLAGKDLQEMDDKTPPDAANLAVGGYVLLRTLTDGVSGPECQKKAEDLLNKHPDVACLVGLWEYNPPALLRAVRNSPDAKKPAIVAFDEHADTLSGIQKDEIVGSVVQNPFEFGYQSIKILAGFAKGNNDVLKDWPGLVKGNSIFIPHRVITKDNVVEFQAEVNKLLGK